MKKWILTNKEWLFSGVGVAIISSSITFFWPKITDPKDQIFLEQEKTPVIQEEVIQESLAETQAQIDHHQEQTSSGSSVNVQVQDVPGQVTIQVPPIHNDSDSREASQEIDDGNAVNLPESHDFLVGKWVAEGYEFGLYTRLVWHINQNGTVYYQYYIEDQLTEIFGTWRFSDGIIYETYSDGNQGKGLINKISPDEFELTIVDNDIQHYRSMKRRYKRM